MFQSDARNGSEEYLGFDHGFEHTISAFLPHMDGLVGHVHLVQWILS